MKRIVIIAVIVAAALAGVAFYSGMFSRDNAAQAADAQQAAPGGAPAGRQGGGARGGGRGQLTVELAPVVHAEVDRELAVVGNLIGDQTVSVVPSASPGSRTRRFANRSSRPRRRSRSPRRPSASARPTSISRRPTSSARA